MKLKNKTAVVTGAARGLGKAIAQRFLEEGAQVIITDINAESLGKAVSDLKAYGEVSAVVMDVTDFDSVQQKFADIIAHSTAV